MLRYDNLPAFCRKAPGGAAGIAAITLRVVSAASPAAAPLQGERPV